MLNRLYKIGFTLIELLVVISIISLLSSVVYSSVDSARKSARDSVRLATLKQIELALEMYRSDFGRYPLKPRDYGESTTVNNTYTWDTSQRDEDGDGIFFLDPLVEEGYISKDIIDPVNTGQYQFLYMRIEENYGACINKPLYIIRVKRFESISGKHPLSPGFEDHCLYTLAPLWRSYSDNDAYVVLREET